MTIWSPFPCKIYSSFQLFSSPNLRNRFLETGEFSDLIIVCGNDRYRVHRLILGGRSNFFKVACNGNFKVMLVTALFIGLGK
jgi:hypothetical protein